MGSGIALAVAGLVALFFARSEGGTIRTYQVLGPYCTLFSLVMSIFANKFELRQRGIVGGFALYLWDQIEGWSWETRGPSAGYQGMVNGSMLRENAVLRIVRRKAGPLRQFAPVPVAAEKVDEVSNVLNQFLGEWPQTPGMPSTAPASGRRAKRGAGPRPVYLGLAALTLAGMAIYAASHEMQIDGFMGRQTRAAYGQEAGIEWRDPLPARYTFCRQEASEWDAN